MNKSSMMLGLFAVIAIVIVIYFFYQSPKLEGWRSFTRSRSTGYNGGRKIRTGEVGCPGLMIRCPEAMGDYACHSKADCIYHANKPATISSGGTRIIRTAPRRSRR